MPTITCSGEECGAEIEFDLSELEEVEASQPSGNHTTQHSGSCTAKCKICGTETEVSCVWDELDDTGEILNVDFV